MELIRNAQTYRLIWGALPSLLCCLPIHVHGISLFIRSSLISFIRILPFSKYRSLSCVKCLPKYSSFQVIINGIVLNVRSACLLIIYRNAVTLCGLVLYPMTLLNSLFLRVWVFWSLIISKNLSFLVDSLGFYM